MSTGTVPPTANVGTIDRSQVHVCLRLRTLTRATLTSVVVCAAVPVAALLCLAAGCVAFAACWLIVLLLVAASFGSVLVGGGLTVASFNENTRGAAAGGIPLGILGFYLISVFSPWYAPIKAAADSAFAACQRVGDYLYADIFIGFYVYAWSWSVLAAALLAAGAVLVTIWLLGFEPRIKRSLLQIRYTCPAEGCRYQDVPFFRCPGLGCPAVLSDLRPTIFGVFRVPCSVCGTSLPTCDVAGRLSLEKQCPRCLADLEHPAFGKLGEMHLVFAGASSSGKSNLMVAAIRELERTVAPACGLTVQFTNPAEEQYFRSRCSQMDQGQVLEKTISAENPAAFNLSLENARGKGALLYVYDTDGSDFETEDRLLGHAFHEYTKGIVLVIDPFAERRMTAEFGLGSDAELAHVSPATSDVDTVLGTLISRFEHVLGERAQRKLPVPVAVVVAKVDACDLENRTGGIAELPPGCRSVSRAAVHAASRSSRVRQFLRDGGLGNVVNNIESRFYPVAYFSASALGRSFSPGDGAAFSPRGVWAPLTWLCSRSGAISDAPTVLRMLANGWQAFKDSLRGHEGTRAAVVAWVFASCICTIGFTTVWHFTGFVPAIAVSGGVVAVAGLAGLFRRKRKAWGSG